MVKIEKLIPGGEALGTGPDGKKIFFWNALPGEIITEYQITKNKNSYTRAIATKIENPSPHRVEPKDACFLSTSPWQIMDYDYELKQKSALVAELFREHGIKIDNPEIITDGKDYFYRNKMEYSLYYDHDQAKIFPAFHARGSHRKIPITNSSIERPEIFAAATKIIDDLNARGEEARKYQSLLLRCNQNGEVSGGLYENGHPHPKFNNLTDVILDREYSYSPNGFFQINLPVYELALKEIKKHIKTNRVLDLYAGVGTIGLSTSQNKSLTLVECDKSAFAELRKNCAKAVFWGHLDEMARNASVANAISSENMSRTASWPSESEPPVKTGGRTGSKKKLLSDNGNILAVSDKAEEALNYIEPNQTVILDPPRAGCDKKLIDKLNDIKPKTIIYLSCNPATQARDVKLLSENYQIKTIKTFNFFPRTPHIENLVILSLF